MFALKNAGYEVEGFFTGAQFRKGMEERFPDLILLDVMLPDVDGLDVLQRLRSRQATADIPVIMVTAKTSEVDKVKGLDLGADDYMTKPFGVMEMISRVKAMLRRVKLQEKDQVLKFAGIVLDESRREVRVDGKQTELTFKEFELLKILLNAAGIVLPRNTILDKVWGSDFEGESRTLDMHIKTLRQKLGVKGKMIQTIRNVGYTLNYIKEE
jgi:two-component system alkaline phosphatase synthesis response regulator PhoP